jgi:CrcB protein
MAGLLGGFTTYSSFALETLRLAADAQWIQAVGYVGLTNTGALVAVWGGYRLTQLL